MITRLTNNLPLAINPEPEPQPSTPPAALPQPALGIAGTADGFQSADPNANDYSSLMQQGSVAVSQPALNQEATVDASSVFDFAEAEQPSPPQPPQAGLGQALEDFTEKKITDLYEKKTSKDFGPDPDRETLSETATWGGSKVPDNIGSAGNAGGTTAGDLKGSWNLLEFGKIDEKDEGDWGSAYAKGSTQVLGVSGEIYYNAGVDLEKKTISGGIGAKGSLEIVGAHYEAGYRTPQAKIGDEEVDLNGKINADAYVGAKGFIELGVKVGGENEIKLGGGAFDGAHAQLAGQIGVGDMANVSGDLKAWAGVGAKAGIGAEYKDGKAKVDIGLGLALGIGAEWDLGFTVDFSEVADTGLEGMREIGLGEEADWIENTVNDGIQFAGDAAHWLGDAAEDAGKAIGGAAEDTGDAIGDALDEIGDAAEDVGDELGGAVDDIGDALDDWF